MGPRVRGIRMSDRRERTEETCEGSHCEETCEGSHCKKETCEGSHCRRWSLETKKRGVRDHTVEICLTCQVEGRVVFDSHKGRVVKT